jgi:hypothetical protein
MARRKNKKGAAKAKTGELIRRLRKPMAPPTRVVNDDGKYNRTRERDSLRRRED